MRSRDSTQAGLVVNLGGASQVKAPFRWARLCSRNNLYARAVYAHGLKAANTNAAIIIVPGGAIHPHRQTKQSKPMRRISS